MHFDIVLAFLTEKFVHNGVKGSHQCKGCTTSLAPRVCLSMKKGFLRSGGRFFKVDVRALSFVQWSDVVGSA